TGARGRPGGDGSTVRKPVPGGRGRCGQGWAGRDRRYRARAHRPRRASSPALCGRSRRTGTEVSGQDVGRPRASFSTSVLHVAEDTRQRIGLDLEPPDALIVAPPPQLPARVPAIRPRHGKRKLLESQLSAYVGQRFG